MSSHIDNCPHCGTSIIDFYQMWAASDYRDEFSCVCGECDGIIAVEVHQCPEFVVSKPFCAWCQKATDGTEAYCAECAVKLRKLSEHNSREN